MSLLLTAVLLFAMLAMAALAIDGVHLYLVRSEAQRAADAAALAAAQSFLDDGFMSGITNAAAAQAVARQRAEAVGALNLVGGQAPSIQDADVTFDFSRPGDPLVTVVAQRSKDRGNAVPTFFARLWGYASNDVKARATAEAFNPSGSTVPATGSCLKPWILPNCDPQHDNPANPNCGGGTFINPDGTISNPGLYGGAKNRGGVIGEPIVLKYGDPHNAPAPSQYYPIQIPSTPNPLCPDCAKLTGNQGPNGAAVYRENIECCNANQFVCGANGTVDLSLQTGNMQGPTRQGVQCLIHQSPNGGGQDTLDQNTLQITGGTNNPNPAAVNQPISWGASSSVVTMPIYDGHTLCPGASCNTTVTIIGFMQIFIRDVSNGNSANVNAYVLNVAGCGSTGNGGAGGGGGSGGGVPGAAGSPIPVRLVHP
ncbi:MAG TPA: pilus assembly protein TadG-related protein [Terriglobales bacterium]|nr:pilus assembly protein TadG-related protein [Terriglobales bacterium]